MDTISERCYNQNQSWNYERTVNVDGTKLRVQIRRNAYDMQSFARVHIWDGSNWNVVCSRPISECTCKTISYVQDKINDGLFKSDADSILKEAMQIVA